MYLITIASHVSAKALFKFVLSIFEWCELIRMNWNDVNSVNGVHWENDETAQHTMYLVGQSRTTYQSIISRFLMFGLVLLEAMLDLHHYVHFGSNFNSVIFINIWIHFYVCLYRCDSDRGGGIYATAPPVSTVNALYTGKDTRYKF